MPGTDWYGQSIALNHREILEPVRITDRKRRHPPLEIGWCEVLYEAVDPNSLQHHGHASGEERVLRRCEISKTIPQIEDVPGTEAAGIGCNPLVGRQILRRSGGDRPIAIP